LHLTVFIKNVIDLEPVKTHRHWWAWERVRQRAERCCFKWSPSCPPCDKQRSCPGRGHQITVT